MLDSFVFSLNSSLPVFLVILLGIFLKKIKLFNENFTSVLDKYVFKVALPILLFRDISAMDFYKDFDVKFVVFCAVTTFVMFMTSWLIAFVFLKDKTMVGSFAQGSARGSAAILGIALAQNIYGSSGLAPLMILSAVPLFNILSVIILTVSATPSDGIKKKTDVKKILFNIITNPIILGIAAGVPFSLLEIELPVILSKTISSVSNTATPMALLSIGGAFSVGTALTRLKPALFASLLKLFVIPAVFLPIAIHLGFTGSALVAIYIMLGSPTTVTCYVMSKNMDNDAVLSSNIVMLATLLSVFSITFWVFLLRVMELI